MRKIIDFPLYSLVLSTISMIFGGPPFPFGNPILQSLLWILILRGLVIGGGVVRDEMDMVRVLELKAATSWCQNFPAEGHFRDSNSSWAVRDGGSHGLRGLDIYTAGLAGSQRFKNGPFQK